MGAVMQLAPICAEAIRREACPLVRFESVDGPTHCLPRTWGRAKALHCCQTHVGGDQDVALLPGMQRVVPSPPTS